MDKERRKEISDRAFKRLFSKLHASDYMDLLHIQRYVELLEQ